MESSIANLAKSLALAQSKITAPKKRCKVDFVNNKGQRVKYNYADLADVLDSIRLPLSANGLALVHSMVLNEQGYGLITKLLHESGEFIETWYPLPNPELGEIKPQEFGSALTYARRYSVSSLVGIASDEDDDGSIAPTRPPQRPPQQQKAEQAPQSEKEPEAFRKAREQRERAEQEADRLLKERESEPLGGEPEPTFEQPAGKYLITFGKFINKTIESVKPSELEGYIKYIEEQVAASGKPLTPKVEEFIFFAKQFLAGG